MAYQALTFEKKENVMIIRIIGPLEGPEGVARLSLGRSVISLYV